MAELLKPKRTPYPPTEKEVERQLKKHYREGWALARSLLAEIHARYTSGETLTRTDMVTYNRLVNTERDLALILADTYKKNTKYVYESLESAYMFGYFSQVYEMEMMSDVLLGFGGVDPRTIEKALSESLTGLTLNERLKKNEQEIVYKVRQELAQSLIQAETFQEAAKRFKNVFEGDAVKCMRVAKTEIHRVEEESSNATREKAVGKFDFEEVWLSTLDRSTRRSHQNMDQKTKGDDGYFNVNGFQGRFPGDPMLPAKEVVNCRCTTVIRLPDRPIGERRGRISLDPETRRNNGLFPGDMTYNEWYQQRMVDE